MIDIKFAQRQMERMIGLKFGPRASQARAEVLKVLMQAASEVIIEGTVTAWLDNRSEFPTPAELRAIMVPLNEAWQAKQRERTAGCIACGGSGFVAVTGISRFDDAIVSGVKPCICRTTGIPVKSQFPGCGRCQGHGIYGGQIGTDFDGPWKWCECEAGRERQHKEPGLIAEANTAREKLIRLGVDPMKPKTFIRKRKAFEPLKPAADAYHGDF